MTSVVVENGTPTHAGNTLARTCGAKTRSGRPCANTAVMLNGRCRMHGGKVPCGAALPQFKHGRYSKYLKHLPADMRARQEQIAKDEEYLNLKDDIGLWTNRMMELLDGLSTVKDRGEVWAQLGEAMDRKVRACVAEWKRLHDLAGLIEVDKVLSIVKGFMTAIKEEVKDKETLQALNSKIMYLLPPPEELRINE